MKQVIILRTDLKMSTGKLVSQACHASMLAYSNANRIKKWKWKLNGMKKVVLKVKGLRELKTIFRKAKKAGVNAKLVMDAGYTQVESGSITALGIGPDKDEKIDKITGKLKLL